MTSTARKEARALLDRFDRLCDEVVGMLEILKELRPRLVELAEPEPAALVVPPTAVAAADFPTKGEPPPDGSDLWARHIAERSVETRNALAEFYLPWLQTTVARYSRKLPPVEQDPAGLIGYAAEGLLHAIDRFEPAQGAKFTTFALRRVLGAIVDGLRGLDWVPRLARVEEKQRGVDVVRMHSLQGLLRSDGEPTPDHVPALGRETKITDHDFWWNVCRGLSKRERLILLLYWREGLSMKLVAQQLDLTESRVCQLHSQLLERLRTVGRVAA